MENYERIENPNSNRQESWQGPSLPIEDHPIDAHPDEHSISFVEALRISLVALCALAAWLRLWEPFPRISLVGVAGVLIRGWPIFREAGGEYCGAANDHGIVHEHRDHSRRGNS